MGMQASDPTLRNSSIALLQERFRQLQRAKEIRQERELFRILSETLRVNNPTSYYEKFCQGELYQRAPEATVKLQPCLTFMQKDAEDKEHPFLANLWCKDTVKRRRLVFDDEHSDVDVDTSLHL